MNISQSTREEILALYERGLYLQAYKKAETYGPLEAWEGTNARVLAGRLAGNLGAISLGRKLMKSAWRHDKTNAEAMYYYARTLNEIRGPLRALYFIRRYGESFKGEGDLLADWQSFLALVFAQLRDFDEAEAWLDKSEKSSPDNAWLHVEKAYVLEMQDRYAESLAAAQRSLELSPWYRPGVLAMAHTLVLTERYDEALELLTEASKRVESCWVVGQLANLQIELGQLEAAKISYDRYAELTPLLDEEHGKWLNGARADLAYRRGEIEEFVRLAELSDSPFLKESAKRVKEKGGTGERKMLPVGFVRQHHVTCAPATLTTISRYWKMPADHLSVAEEICYDGTPAHGERNWAEQNDWTTREFTVTWETTVELVNRGAAFTLTSVHPGNAHMQAVIGYDSRRETLLIRDPYIHSVSEFKADEFFKNQQSTGPRGMALVPKSEAVLLDNIEFKDQKTYDLLYALQNALVSHDRSKARQILDTMESEFPNHRLTWQGQYALANYDSNPVQQLACTEGLLKLFPEDDSLKLAKLSLLRNQTRRDERLELLKSLCKEKDADPYFFQQYSHELSADGRQLSLAKRMIRKALAGRPMDAGNLYVYANILWSEKRFAEAAELYRFASCLEDKNESFAFAYFASARYLKQTPTALRFLEDRFRRFGSRSTSPTLTLFRAYSDVGLTSDAFDILETALEQRPNDGDLKLFAADAYARYGNLEAASQLLVQAEGKAPRSSWLRTAAMIDDYRSELKSSLEKWRAITELEPLASDAHRHVARLIAETEGESDALKYLEQLTQRFPYNCELLELRLEWLQGWPEQEVPVLNHLLEIDPNNAWGHRERALLLAKSGKHEEAIAESNLAIELGPDNPFGYTTRGKLFFDADKFKEAKADFQNALRLSVDTEYAIGGLLSSCQNSQEKAEALSFIQQELARQVTFGEGLLAFRDQASTLLEPEELLNTLRQAFKERQDLWHAWSAVVCQLIDMDQVEEALKLAKQAVERFPLLPRLWIDLSLCYRITGQRELEIDALKRAHQINVMWSYPIQQLTEGYQRANRLDEAKTMLEQSIARMPLDPYLHGYLAETLWLMGEKEEALKRVERAVILEPGYEWGWSVVREWAKELNRPEIAFNLARELTEKRPGEARSWLVLARTLYEPEDLQERLSAIDKALELNPRLIDAHTLRARLLANESRYDEALAACRPAAWKDRLPMELRYMSALIESDRGNAEESLRQLRALVKDEPDYVGAWLRIAQSVRLTDDKKEYLKIARTLVRLGPQEPLAFGYLGEALMQNADRKGAKEALKKAMILAPDYDFATGNLFDLQMEDSEFEEARYTLGILRQHDTGDLTTLRELEFAIKKGSPDDVKNFYLKICLSETASPEIFTGAASVLQKANYTKLMMKTLEEALTKPNVNTHVGAVWVDEMTNVYGRFEDCSRYLNQFNHKGDLWHEAAQALTEAYAKNGRVSELDKFVAQHRQSLSQHTASWGSIGYAYFAAGDNESVARWMSDWSGREDAGSWMFWNLALALRKINREDESNAVSQAAIRLKEDSTLSAHALMLAVDEALNGRADAARKFAELIDTSHLREWDKFFVSLLKALLDMYSSNNSNAPSEALDSLVELKKQYPNLWNDGLQQQAYFRALNVINRLNPNKIKNIFSVIRAHSSYFGAKLSKSFSGS